MQQTQNYKLNLIETNDPLSPAPLNENADKIEAALLTKTAEARTDGLEQRILTLESKPIIVGSYVGDKGTLATQFIPVGFTPSLVLVQSDTGGLCIAWTDHPWKSVVVIEEGGFRIGATQGWTLNSPNHRYAFIAFA